MKVHIGAGAQRDLAEISGWIAQDNPNAAVRFVDQLVARALQIGGMPRAFPLFLRWNGHEVRKRNYRRYVIFYYLSRSRVEIIRIVHGSQDLSKLFRP